MLKELPEKEEEKFMAKYLLSQLTDDTLVVGMNMADLT